MNDSVPLREYLERLLAERDGRLAEVDRRYEQRFESQLREGAAALVATREALSIALQSAKESSAANVEANRILALKAEEFADQKLATHNSIWPRVEQLVAVQAARIDALEKEVSRFKNREEGVGLTTKIIVGAIGLLATIVGLYLAFGKF